MHLVWMHYTKCIIIKYFRDVGFRRAFVMFYNNLLFGLLRVWWSRGGGSDHHCAAVSRRSRSFNTVSGICTRCLQVSCVPFLEVNCATQTYYLYQRPFFTPNCYLSLSLVSQLTFSFTNKKYSKKKRNWLSSKDPFSSFGKVKEMKLELHCMKCYPF